MRFASILIVIATCTACSEQPTLLAPVDGGDGGGGGAEPSACPPGQLAPVDATTQYVDSEASGPGDGSAESPWTTVQAAIDAADARDVIAIAAGEYVGPLVLSGKPVNLWGVCPERVFLNSDTTSEPTLRAAATGSSLHQLSLSGSHSALRVEADLSADVTVLDSVVRDTLPGDAGSNGVGIVVDREGEVERGLRWGRGDRWARRGLRRDHFQLVARRHRQLRL